MSEWKKFKVGAIPAHGGGTLDCTPLDLVSHTSHIDSALKIIEDEEVKPYLVFDESKLNTERILVSWVSPNQWSEGYRYGGIQFNFSFKDLIAGKHFYWVESIAYNTAACRILITANNRSPLLMPYDPTSGDGPWLHDVATDRHYFNGKYCLEFMIEAPISTLHLRELRFVQHHLTFCSIHRNSPSDCVEKSYSWYRCGAAFLTRAMTRKMDLSPLLPRIIAGARGDLYPLKTAHGWFISRVAKSVPFTGNLTANSDCAAAVARAIMSAYTFGSIVEARSLCNLFESETEFEQASAKVTAQEVGLSNWTDLLDSVD